LTSSSYESTTSGLISNNNIIGQTGLPEYAVSSQTAFESNTDINGSYTAGASNELAGGSTTIQTNSAQQTNEYLSRRGTGIFNDPNPQIVRRPAAGGPVTYQQKILVRFLQPPAIPPPGVIKQMFYNLNNYIYLFHCSHLLLKKYVHHNHLHLHRLSYVNVHHLFRHRLHLFYANVHQYLRLLWLVKQVQEKKNYIIKFLIFVLFLVIRRLAPVPVPPRSVIIERLPPLPPKPRKMSSSSLFLLVPVV
jgi:hypothetical protein